MRPTPAQEAILARLRAGDRIHVFGTFDGRDPRPEWQSNLPEAPPLRRDVLERMRKAGLVTWRRITPTTQPPVYIVEAA